MKINYKVVSVGEKSFIRKTRYENLCMIDEYFTGYDWMGTANWSDSTKDVMWMDHEEAEQIVKDLEAAYEPSFAHKAYDKLPKASQDRIEQIRKNLKEDYRHRELYLSIGKGYLEGLRDAGCITEAERKILRCYLTV